MTIGLHPLRKRAPIALSVKGYKSTPSPYQLLPISLSFPYHIPTNSLFSKRCYAVATVFALLWMLVLGKTAAAQDTVLLPSAWWVTIDDATQQLTLRWTPSPTPSTRGYHLCTGTPCIDYDTVFGRTDTTLVCPDHSPLAPHTYRLHVFDSSGRVSPLTPPFGNIVLQAEVPKCTEKVAVSWSPYVGALSERPHYELYARADPIDENFIKLYETADSTALHYEFDLPDEAQRIHLLVSADIGGGRQVASNRISVDRRTTEEATAVEITSVEYDSVHTHVLLTLSVDTAYPYCLYRSIDGTAWQLLDSLHPSEPTVHYTDTHINPYDSLHCYQLEVRDACGLNPRYSTTTCLVVPTPPPPAAYFPNIIIADDAEQCAFKPVVQGLLGDLYELHIYNRNGQLLFRTFDPQQSWIPPANTPQGTYTYHLRCRFNNNEIHNYFGSVTLIR